CIITRYNVLKRVYTNLRTARAVFISSLPKSKQYWFNT
ncbi:LPS-assembly protein LptD precursor, partial [Haemophilus influenzae]